MGDQQPPEFDHKGDPVIVGNKKDTPPTEAPKIKNPAQARGEQPSLATALGDLQERVGIGKPGK